LLLLRGCAIVAAACALSACSGVQIGYRHADIFLSWKVNEYFDLDPAQDAMVKPAIAAALAWHRRTELPEYVQLLQTVQGKLKAKVAPEDVHWFDDQTKMRTRAAITQLAIEGAPILATVTPAQVIQLEQRLVKDNETFFDKYARGTVEKQQGRRAKRFIENAEYWVGGLTDAQKDAIEKIVAETPTRYARQLEERKRIQSEFVALLREKNTPATIVPKLKAWIANWDAGRSPAFVEIVKVSNDQLERMTLAVTDSMTPSQRQHAQEQLQSYIDTMNELVKESAGKA
jgi:hypothetical protein